MLIYQGWFTALYTVLNTYSINKVSSSKIAYYKHSICRQYVTLTYFSKGGYPVTLLPPPRRLVPSLGLGTTWVRQLRSGSCHHPTAATKCNVSGSKPQQTPSGEKHAHPPSVVYCAIYSTLTRFTKFRV